MAGWTGANEKTVKYWFSGRYGPRGEHLAILVRQSDEVLSTFLIMAGRQDLMAVAKLAAAERAILICWKLFEVSPRLTKAIADPSERV